MCLMLLVLVLVLLLLGTLWRRSSCRPGNNLRGPDGALLLLVCLLRLLDARSWCQ